VLTFKCIAGHYRGKSYTIKLKYEECERVWMVGRSPDMEICLYDSPSISRCHAKISYTQDQYWEIEDIGSTSGTYICVGNSQCYSSYEATDIDMSIEIQSG
jgi:hypothetical protein